MVATFLQDDLAAELEKVFKDVRMKNPQGEPSPINIFKQELPIPAPATPPAIREMATPAAAPSPTTPFCPRAWTKTGSTRGSGRWIS